MDDINKKLDDLKSSLASLVDVEVDKKLHQIVDFVQGLMAAPSTPPADPPKQYLDVGGILRKYKRDCAYCDREFATDIEYREHCSRSCLIADEGELPDAEKIRAKNNAEYQKRHTGKRKHVAMPDEVKNSDAGLVARSEGQQIRRSIEKEQTRRNAKDAPERHCLNCDKVTTRGPYCSDDCRKADEAQFKDIYVKPADSTEFKPLTKDFEPEPTPPKVAHAPAPEIKLTPPLPATFSFEREAERSRQRILEKRLGIKGKPPLSEESLAAIEKVKEEARNEASTDRRTTNVHRPASDWATDNETV